MRCFVALVLAFSLGVSVSAQPSQFEDGDLRIIPNDSREENPIVDKIKKLESHLAQTTAGAFGFGHLLVNGPLPSDFSERFMQAVAKATGANPKSVKVTGSEDVQEAPGIVEIAFKASPKVVDDVENQAAEPKSKLSKGNLHSFLVAKDESEKDKEKHAEKGEKKHDEKHDEKHEKRDEEEHEATPVAEKGIDIDTQMPFGDLEPFGREDTAQELTESSVTESDAMVDQLERAEVAEEKRAVFRALTRLRGAAITSFDGVARSQTGNIDEYNKVHKWRKSHPMHHLADEEADITKWAFPDNADLIQKKTLVKK